MNIFYCCEVFDGIKTLMRGDIPTTSVKIQNNNIFNS